MQSNAKTVCGVAGDDEKYGLSSEQMGKKHNRKGMDGPPPAAPAPRKQ